MMQLDWIYSPVTQYSLTAMGLAASLVLWIGAKAEVRNLRMDLAAAREKWQGELRDLSAGLDEIRAARQTVPEPLSMPVGQALNLTKRAQVLRMHNRGESVHSIAAALQIPAGEVSLLLKIEHLTDADAEPATATR